VSDATHPGTVRRLRVDGAAVVAGLLVLVACAIPASTGRADGLERDVFEAINGLSDAIEPTARAAELLGVLAVGPLVALVALLARRPRLAVAAMLVTAGKLLAERLVWQVLERERPGVTQPEAIVRGDTPTSGVSFVSGHVVLVSGLAWVITPYLRGRWRVAPWIVVAIVAVARVYLGAHNPLDVLGGLGLGVAIGAAVNLALGVPRTEGTTPPPVDAA
jgi:undecaprenyl-diphosphatase